MLFRSKLDDREQKRLLEENKKILAEVDTELNKLKAQKQEDYASVLSTSIVRKMNQYVANETKLHKISLHKSKNIRKNNYSELTTESDSLTTDFLTLLDATVDDNVKYHGDRPIKLIDEYPNLITFTFKYKDLLASHHFKKLIPFLEKFLGEGNFTKNVFDEKDKANLTSVTIQITPQKLAEAFQKNASQINNQGAFIYTQHPRRFR